MGVVRAWLRDDVETSDWALRATAADPVETGVDEDVVIPPVVETRVTHDLTVRLRTRNGYDDDGVPLFEWTVLLTGPAILWEEREEFDAHAGLTRVKAKATMLYEGETQVTESALVTRGDDTSYRVKGVRQVPGRLEFDLERIAQ